MGPLIAIMGAGPKALKDSNLMLSTDFKYKVIDLYEERKKFFESKGVDTSGPSFASVIDYSPALTRLWGSHLEFIILQHLEVAVALSGLAYLEESEIVQKHKGVIFHVTNSLSFDMEGARAFLDTDIGEINPQFVFNDLGDRELLKLNWYKMFMFLDSLKK